MTFTGNIQVIGIDEATFQASTEDQRVEWGKQNWTAFAGLCKAAQTWIIGMQGNVYGEFECHPFSVGWTMPDASIPKVAPDYQPPVKRWWFNPDTKQIAVYPQRPWTVAIEVTADYAAYLSEKPEGEWELRKPEEGEIILIWTTGRLSSPVEAGMAVKSNDTPQDRGYRWCKPKAVAGWVEYPVVVRGGFYMVYGYNGSDIRLDKAANRVGFGGVQFEGFDEWSMLTTMFARKYDGCLSFIFSDTTDRPSIPVRARFWEVPQ